MDKLVINGPCKLKGEVEISCAKNAYLPILAGCLLNENKIELRKLPNLRDINTMKLLLSKLGCQIKKSDNADDSFIFDSIEVASLEATYDLVKTMRASILVLGPMLGRFKKGKVSLPGGCAIGSRPIDIHLKNLEKMGARITFDGGYVMAECDGLIGAELDLSFPSVGATENLMLAATLAKGQTIINNAAKEPEIIDLANFINSMGGDIQNAGESSIKINGVEKLHETSYQAIGDRIEASTYIIAGLITGSEITVKGFDPGHIESVLTTLREMGGKFTVTDNSVIVHESNIKAISVETFPYPGFPTDVQAQLVALMTQAKGTSIMVESIFENRFMHIPELNRMGSKIMQDGNKATIEGPANLKAAPVMCTDLRASAALVLASLVAEGKTEVLRVYHLDRGYENLGKKLGDLGADITREKY
jgi:UDP-N-acetylglucosamine 1-carboxyvinyltransferase